MTWEVVKEQTYNEWHTFSGDYTQVVATFQTGPEQLTWLLTNPIGTWLANKVRDQAVNKGAVPLYFRLLKDTKTSTWVTYWQIDFWAYERSPLHAGVAFYILIGAIAALGIGYFSFQIVSEIQTSKRAEIAKESEQAKIDFVEKYEPIYGGKIFEWLKDIKTVPESVKETNPSLIDDLKKTFGGISIGLVIAGIAALFLLTKR